MPEGSGLHDYASRSCRGMGDGMTSQESGINTGSPHERSVDCLANEMSIKVLDSVQEDDGEARSTVEAG